LARSDFHLFGPLKTTLLADVLLMMKRLKQVQKWLRQQSKDFSAVGFGAPVKRWDKFINFGGGYIRNNFFFPRLECYIFYILYPFVTYLLTLLHTISLQPASAGFLLGLLFNPED
jgi:hypothetical protein